MKKLHEKKTWMWAHQSKIFKNGEAKKQLSYHKELSSWIFVVVQGKTKQDKTKQHKKTSTKPLKTFNQKGEKKAHTIKQ